MQRPNAMMRIEGIPRASRLNKELRSQMKPNQDVKRHIFKFERSWDSGNLSALTTEVDTAFSFQLSDLPSYTEFTALFDQYRIVGVDMHFIPHQNTCPVTSANATTTNILIAPDYDDATAVNLAALLQKAGLKIYNFNKEFHFFLKPMIAAAAYSGTFTSYLSMEPQWIDVASPSVVHYGVKTVMTPCSSTNLSGWRVFLTYHLEFRMVI